jgi:hypothetical protein
LVVARAPTSGFRAEDAEQVLVAFWRPSDQGEFSELALADFRLGEIDHPLVQLANECFSPVDVDRERVGVHRQPGLWRARKL